MSVERPARTRARPRRRLRWGRVLAAVAVLVVVFLLGVALGEALHDNPQPGRTRTFLRTFVP